jgi:glycosyltransferase involved in cell wall biosynthesis
MKVIHLSSSLTNGAGSAAKRIHDALKSVGADSEIWTNGRTEENSDTSVIATKKSMQARNKSKLNTVLQKYFLQVDNRLMTPISIQTLDVRNIIDAKPAIINVHSMYNYLNFKTLHQIRRLNIPLVITLHDERFYTGGCHNTFGCKNFENFCAKCPQGSKRYSGLIERVFQKESEHLRDVGNMLQFVGPSEWVLQQARSSGKISKGNYQKIPNPVPDIFRAHPSDIQSVSSKIDEPLQIGFCAADINSPYKGFQVLLNGLFEASEKGLFKFVLNVAGNGYLDDSCYPFAITRVKAKTEFDLANFYRNLDLLIVPSLGDNSPSVISEALMSGTKVIGSRVGGIPEQLKFNDDLLFDKADEQSMLSCIIKNLSSYNRNKLSEESYSSYCFKSVGNAYAAVYKSMVGE